MILEAISCVVENDNMDFVINTVFAIINAIVAIINIGLLLHFNLEQKKEKCIERKINYNVSWYNTIDLNQRVNSIEDIIRTTTMNIIELNNNTEDAVSKRRKIAEPYINYYDDKLIEEKNKVNNIIKCIDEKSASEICEIFRHMQDELSELINQAVGGQCSLSFADLENIKAKLVTKYYEVGEKIIDNSF